MAPQQAENQGAYPNTGCEICDAELERQRNPPATGCEICDEDILEQQREDDDLRREAEW